ncbi:MAG: bifunctional phosphoribosyl-AMP cyclohydrolase/phosphoribosyl-ATP diphosphatase HisIE [Firmicutes bacterium]|jgi:phosphoribosyl-ATP pyrophosphohydrolase/phosphoribosyl-AMP cyclohydrolase|nr:bifunctional phosphoribosyl-AMP cyclohydrolase/phosphoribosyl-ATP diphosphatase HisIE [Bacillota bacterium]
MKTKLWPVVVQDVTTGQVLMLAYADAEALALTKQTGEGWYWSRSRQKLWRKGETSGNTQQVVEVRVDCDNDALLYLVKQQGPACHTGEKSCFFRVLSSDDYLVPPGDFTLDDLFNIINERIEKRPAGSYVSSLIGRGNNRVLQKIGEEATEAILALRDLDIQPTESQGRQRAVEELADLCFHVLVAMACYNIEPEEVVAELAARRKEER